MTCEYIFQKNTNTISNFPEFLFQNFCKFSFYEQFRIFRKIFQNILTLIHSRNHKTSWKTDACITPGYQSHPPVVHIMGGSRGGTKTEIVVHLIINQ